MIPAEFQGCLAAQRNAYLADQFPGHAQQVADLQLLARSYNPTLRKALDALGIGSLMAPVPSGPLTTRPLPGPRRELRAMT